MRKRDVGIILIIFLICSQKAYAKPYVLENDTIITHDILEGIKVDKDCTITFTNDQDIQIGSCNNGGSGIEVKNGKTLTINLAGDGNVNVCSGYYIKDDNEYDCAGIYVPNDSSLIIDSEGQGMLNIYPFDKGAGIGGHGIFIEKMVSNLNCIDAGKIIIERGNVVVHNPMEARHYGMGARIGGGGMCNVSNDAKMLFGGNLRKFEMLGGKLTIMLNYGSNSRGIGAAIGGGGLANFNDIIGSIQGGDAREIELYGGRINIENTQKDPIKGQGSLIGGGGIYNNAKAGSIQKGQLYSKQSQYKAHIKTSSNEKIYGDGEIYNNGTFIYSINQAQGTKNRVDTIGSYIVDKLLSIGVILSGAFMVFELVT